MFIFTSNVAQTGLNRVFSATQMLGAWKIKRRGSAALAWLETPFIQVCESSDTLVVSLGRPREREPVCVVDWNLDGEHLTISRQWSGEFGILLVRRPVCIVTSHLRLAAAACGGAPVGMKPVAAGGSLRLNLRKPLLGKWKRLVSFRAANQLNYADTVREVRKLIYASVQRLPESSGLLLSGGLDSSIIAAVARAFGRKLPVFVFAMNRIIQKQSEHERDLHYARIVAKHLGLSLTEILLESRQLARNVPLAILLTETSRGTIVDPCAALIEVAKQVSQTGISSLIMGEAADDLFGSFTFALRYMKGEALRSYYQHELDFGLPEEMANLQRAVEPWGLVLVDPFWTRELKAIGYNIPLSFRLDPARAMKRILRDAFEDLLPEEIIHRPKVVTRNGSQVRYALEKRFGISRERYRPIFRKIFKEGGPWPSSL